MRLLVGCPVYRRDWILPQWFEHVEAAAKVAGVDRLQYIFVADASDTPTVSTILAAQRSTMWICQPELVPHSGARVWNHDRFKWMVDLRNLLLAGVQKSRPDAFLSLDSDILLHPESIKNMLESLNSRFDVVGGKLFMSGGTTCPSWATLSPSAGLVRSDADGVFPVQVVMACKLMNPKAYQVDYSFSPQGEDIGWSLNAAEAGCRIGWDGRVTNKHVMERDQLHVLDKRSGF